MKITIVEREESTFRGIEATETRKLLAGLEYTADEKVLTMAELNTVINTAKETTARLLEECDYNRCLSWAQGNCWSESARANLPCEVIAAVRIAFHVFYHAGINKFYPLLVCENDQFELVEQSAVGHIIGSYTTVCGWLRKMFHSENFTPEMIDASVGLFNVCMHYSGYTSCDQDKVLRNTVFQGENYNSHEIGSTFSYLYSSYEGLSVPAPLASPWVYQADTTSPACRTVVAGCVINTLGFRTLVFTDEGPMWFGYKTGVDLLRANPYFGPLGKTLAGMKVDNEVIKDALLRFKAAESDSTLVIYPNDCRFMHAYRLAHDQDTISSCMSKPIRNYHSGKSSSGFEYYPLDAYSSSYFTTHDNSLALFTLVRGDKIISRAIVNVEREQAVRFYGSHKLACILKQMGIVQDSDALDEVYLARLINTDGDLVGPYLDGSPDNVSFDCDSSLMQVVSNAAYSMTDTDGYYQTDGSCTCEMCGNHVHDDDLCWLSGSEMYVCSACYENDCHECPIDELWYRERAMSWICLDGSWTWVADCNMDKLYKDDAKGCTTYYSTLDEMVETEEGYLTHVDNAVELKDNTWVLLSNYDRDAHGPRLCDEDEEEEDDE